jgi:hypothetical protein
MAMIDGTGARETGQRLYALDACGAAACSHDASTDEAECHMAFERAVAGTSTARTAGDAGGASGPRFERCSEQQAVTGDWELGGVHCSSQNGTMLVSSISLDELLASCLS